MAFLLGATMGARADISPTTFIGSGITSRQSTVVRMERAEVEIVWGTPCSLVATFCMWNPTATPDQIEVCFPMPRDDGLDVEAADGLSVSFDGEKAIAMPPDPSDHHYRWKWFHCRHAFPPGGTTVVVRTELRASLLYDRPGRETINYCVESGGNWAGTIGEETVTVRFPIPAAELAIEQSEPAEPTANGNCVRWHWRDIEPQGPEYDIAFSYIRPDLLQTIARLRAELAAAPESSAAAVKLARHLLAFGPNKSNSGYPPGRLTARERADILAKLPSWWKRQSFRREYRLREDGTYEQKTWGLSKRGGWRVVELLAEIGYRDERSRGPFVLEGEALLKGVLEREGDNAEAWNVYLAEYWRFSYAAVGHRFGPVVLSRTQERLIKTAAQRCPDDPCIRRWVKLISAESDRDDFTALEAEIERQGFLKLEFPKIQYGYY